VVIGIAIKGLTGMVINDDVGNPDVRFVDVD
jgi:hypothetical protein